MRRYQGHTQIVIAPAYWAAYLIHRDPGRVHEHDGADAPRTLERIDQWLEIIRPLSIRDVLRRHNGEQSSAYWPDFHDCKGYFDDFSYEITFFDYLAMPVKPNR